MWVLSNVESSTAGNADMVVEILQGWTPAQVGDTPRAAGVIASSAAFQEVAASTQSRLVVAGSYDFVADSDPREALDTLRGGPRRICPTSSCCSRRASRCSRSPSASASSRARAPQRFLQVAAVGHRPVALPAQGGQSLEGLTWPDTYFIGANETEAQILQRIVAQFDAEADDSARARRRRAVAVPGAGRSRR